MLLSLLSEFTGLYGLLKCKQKDFSGYILKTTTILVPILVLIGILIYLASDVKFNLYWVKIIIDVLTIAISIILIAFVTGLIKAEINNLIKLLSELEKGQLPHSNVNFKVKLEEKLNEKKRKIKEK